MTRLSNSTEEVISAAAASLILVSVPVGEYWRIQEVVAWHDDPAGADLYWAILGEGSLPILVLPVGATAISIRTRLSNYYNCPFWLPPTAGFRISTPAPLAAGKKFYLDYHVSKARGVAPGSWL